MKYIYNLIIIHLIIINTIDCVDKNVRLLKLNKCCSNHQIVGKNNNIAKQCFDRPDQSLDYSSFQIYNFKQEMEKSDKKFHDIFHVDPYKFADERFRIASENTASRTFKKKKVYLTETGYIYLEVPNAYNRWFKIEPTHFCLDFYTSILVNKTRASFWLEGPPNLQDQDDGYLTVAMVISCCFLIIVLMVYGFLPELRNLCGLILIAYVASLLMAFLLLVMIREGNFTDVLCYILTLAIYYFFLASFCWMNVMSYDIWWTFRGYAKARPIHRRGKPFKYMMYSLFAWGLPLAMTIMLVWINSTDLRHKPWFIKPNLQAVGCFITGGEKLLYLYMPMLILICVNWLFYLMTAFNIWRLSRGTAVLDSAAGTPAAHRNHRQRLLVYLKLSIVMGLNWVLEVVSFLTPQFKLWFISDFYNVLVGVSIFLIFVCKKKILRKLKKQYLQNTNNSTSTTSGSSQEMQTLQVCLNPKGPTRRSIRNDF